MPVWLRYWLFQVPELLAVAILGAFGVYAEWFAAHWVGGVLALLVAKDAALYPWLRSGYVSGPSLHVGPERLVGARGVATEDLRPCGYVWLGGELWSAELSHGGELREGAAVEVEAVEGVRLRVRALGAAQRASGELPLEGDR